MPRRFVLRLFGPRLFKRWAPTSLFGRSLLIIVLPIAIMQLAVTWLFFSLHEDTVTSRLSAGLAGEVAAIVEIYLENPGQLEGLKARAQRTVGISVAFRPEPLTDEIRPNFFRSVDRTLERALDSRLDRPFRFDTARYPSQVAIRVDVPGGHLSFNAPKDRAIATQGHIFVLYLTGASLILTAVAILFIRNQVRAIERLADAAEAFGRGSEVPGFKPHGAREVRAAAKAFLEMRANIQRFMEQRTALLASVSHDLRTPLTRLKLELALTEPSKRVEAMKRDLAEMEHMIDEYLDFARGAASESTETVDIGELATAVAEGARRSGASVSVDCEPGLVAQVRRGAVTRALANLVANAAAYGDAVAISAVRSEDGVSITVEDDGPGIPADRREDAFKPFNRLDESRNQNEKGVGLGLAIARDVARSHGGDVNLAESGLGGLKAVISLPA